MRSQRLEEARKQSLSLFCIDQDVEVIAKYLKVSVKALHGWWVVVFGKEAVRKRGKTRNIASNKRRGLPEGQVRLCKCGKICATNQYKCTVCSTECTRSYRNNLSIEAREGVRTYSDNYRKAHRQELCTKKKDYYTKYPEKSLIHNAKMRAKKYNVPFNITAEYIKSCIPVDGCCPITGKFFEQGSGKVGPWSMSLDRTIPELGYVVGNVLVVSYLANAIKYNCTDPAIFRRVAEYVELANIGQSSVLKFLSDAVAIRSYYPTNYYYAKRPERRMANGAWERAKEHNLPFNIKAKDIRALFPKDGCCPITRLPFERGDGKCGPQSMSLDRIIPELGYVPGNIAIISFTANAIKQNCTDPEVFRRIAQYLESSCESTLMEVG